MACFLSTPVYLKKLILKKRGGGGRRKQGRERRWSEREKAAKLEKSKWNQEENEEGRKRRNRHR